ncbi:Putative aminoglycoside phosphotransferase [Mycobacteroides abscessus subsp. abscessus]|nr:Putative aminoglycoside phosphotransferase [Mycobacteroides abscessus subsp. abscessus]
MSTIGDPLLDLGWMLATWPSETDDASLGGALVQAGGLPTPQELVEHYAERTDRDLGAMDWYTVLACFKLGIILEGTHARACAGKAPVAVGDYLHGLTLQLFKRAVAITG